MGSVWQCTKLDMVAYIYKPRTWKVEARRLGVEGGVQKLSKFESQVWDTGDLVSRQNTRKARPNQESEDSES